MKTLLLAVLLVAGAAAQTYTVAGVVMDVALGKPVERARVSLVGPAVGNKVVTTGADGRFAFDAPQGRYNLVAQHNSWGMQFGNVDPIGAFGSAIITGPGQDTAHLLFRWYSPASIFGTVVDERGDGVRDATVQLFRDNVVAGRRRILATTTSKTDDRGQYRLGPVPAGSYYVVATGRPWQDTLMTRRFQSGESQQPASAYPPTYFPGVADGRDATRLTLPAGGEIRADIPLRAVTGATVKIRCPGSGIKDDACSGQPTFILHGVGGVELPTPAEFDYATQAFQGVPPGRYTVRATAPGKTAYQDVDVGPGESTFNLNLQPQALISGTVTFSHPLPARATAYVGIDNDTTGGGNGYPIGSDGSFTSRAGGGFFRPRLYGSVRLYIAELTADGIPVKTGAVDLTANTTVKLNIVASDEVGSLRGFAMNGERPAPTVMVVLAPKAASGNPTHYLGFQTESDGSFDWPNIPAGDYLLFAVDRLDLEYTNPTVIQPYLQSAIPVHIASKAVIEQRVVVKAAVGQ